MTRAAFRKAMNAKPDIETLLSGLNAAFIEAEYARFLENREALEPEWRAFFDALENGAGRERLREGPSWRRSDWPPAALEKAALAPAKTEAALTRDEVRRATLDSIRALMMIRAYRVRGTSSPTSIPWA